MASANDYNAAHWSKKLQKYLGAAWSHQSSPFAQDVVAYLPKNTRLLELGAGAGQDGLWLAAQVSHVTITDARDSGFSEIKRRAQAKNIANIDLATLDITNMFPFKDSTFDCVYAQLVLHYFDDAMTYQIMQEIRRVLKTGGIFACTVNSVNDPENTSFVKSQEQLVNVGGLMKRFFDLEGFKKFIDGYEVLLYDMNGTSPKDDAKNTYGLVRFIGRKT